MSYGRLERERAVRLSYRRDEGTKDSSASGIHLGDGWVLTANHCAIEGDGAYRVHLVSRGGLVNVGAGTMRWQSGTDAVDLALVFVPALVSYRTESGRLLPRLRLARLDRDWIDDLDVKGGCYPSYAKESGEHALVQLGGIVPLGQDAGAEHATVHLRYGGPASRAELKIHSEFISADQEWKGASGGGLVTGQGELLCVGVIANRRSRETSTAVRIATINGLDLLDEEKRAEFWSLLEIDPGTVPLLRGATPFPTQSASRRRLSTRATTLFMALLALFVIALLMVPQQEPSPTGQEKTRACAAPKARSGAAELSGGATFSVAFRECSDGLVEVFSFDYVNGDRRIMMTPVIAYGNGPLSWQGGDGPSGEKQRKCPCIFDPKSTYEWKLFKQYRTETPMYAYIKWKDALGSEPYQFSERIRIDDYGP